MFIRSVWGGEYLPGMLEGEVEIARVSLKSTTGDQISVRACKQGDTIRYRVVDEYESDFELPIEESERPFSLGEMIDFVDRAEQTGYDYTGGLIQIYWEDPFGSYGSIEERLDFVSAESGFYPELKSYYEELGEAWRLEQDEEES